MDSQQLRELIVALLLAGVIRIYQFKRVSMFHRVIKAHLLKTLTENFVNLGVIEGCSEMFVGSDEAF